MRRSALTSAWCASGTAPCGSAASAAAHAAVRLAHHESKGWPWAAMNASKILAVYSTIWRLWAVSSSSQIVSATDEFLKMFIDSLVSGGITIRYAIGSSTKR